MAVRKNRIIFLIIFFCLLCSCSGCSGTADSEPPELSPPPEPDTLIWLNVGSGYPVDFEIGMKNVNDYLADKGLFRIDLRIIPSNEIMPTLQTMVRSGEYFDLAFTDSLSYNQLVTMGAFYDITDRVRSQSPALWAAVPKLLWQGANVSGRIFAVPTYKDSSQSLYWVFDASYVRKYNIDMSALRDFKDLDVIFRKMKAAEGEDFYPLQYFNETNYNGVFFDYDVFSTGLSPIGVRLDDPERNIVYTLEQPDVVESLTVLHEWYKDGIINPDARTRTEAVDAPVFLSGIGWPGAESFWERLYGVDEYVSTVVKGPILTTDTVQGSMTAVYAGSNYVNEALKVLELINTNHTLRDMLAYGVEGRHFTYESENVVQVLNSDWNMELFSQGSFFVMSQMSDGPPRQWERLLAVNEAAVPSVLMGFMLDMKDISLEINMCNEIWQRYIMNFLTGSDDPAVTVSACMAELKAAGLETIVSEARKQISQFQAPVF